MCVVPLCLAGLLAIKLSICKEQLKVANAQLDYFIELQSESQYLINGNGQNGIPKVKTGDFERNVTSASDVGQEPYDSKETADSKGETSQVKDKIVLTPAEVKALEYSNEELFDGYRKIYLTFDDGPSYLTDDILDILAKYNVKATFFVIQKDGRNWEEIYRRIVNEGHSLGMHSTSHVYSNIYASEEAFIADTESLRNFLYLVTGVESDIYRFPGGSSNHVSPTDMKSLAAVLESEGIEYFDWNVAGNDSVLPLPTVDEIVYNVTHKLMSYDEAIVLLHDVGGKENTVAALPKIIEYIQSMDNTVLLPITNSTNPIQHLSVKVNNIE